MKSKYIYLSILFFVSVASIIIYNGANERVIISDVISDDIQIVPTRVVNIESTPVDTKLYKHKSDINNKSPNFELVISSKEATSYLFMPLNLNFTLSNKGYDIFESVFLDKLGDCLIVHTNLEGSASAAYLHPSQDGNGPMYLKSKDSFVKGDHRNYLLTMYHQRKRPVLNRVGDWKINAKWMKDNPHEDVYASPLTINVIPPEGDDKIVLDYLIENNMVDSLCPYYWAQVGKLKTDIWKKSIGELSENYRSSVYVKQLIIASKSYSYIKEKRRPVIPQPRINIAKDESQKLSKEDKAKVLVFLATVETTMNNANLQEYLNLLDDKVKFQGHDKKWVTEKLKGEFEKIKRYPSKLRSVKYSFTTGEYTSNIDEIELSGDMKIYKNKKLIIGNVYFKMTLIKSAGSFQIIEYMRGLKDAKSPK